jgi:isoamylase
MEGRHADGSFDVLWLTPQATDMTEQDWNFPEGKFLSYVLNSMEQGEPPLYIVLNAAMESIEFKLPTLPEYGRWTAVLDSAPTPRVGEEFQSGSVLQAVPRSVLAFAGTI